MKTNKGLVEYAKAQLGKPYWYGTFGNEASKSLYNSKKKQYPSNYKWDFSQFKMNHVLSSEKMHDVPLHNVYVGIKFSAFLDITRHGVCRICGDDSEIPLWSQY